MERVKLVKRVKLVFHVLRLGDPRQDFLTAGRRGQAAGVIDLRVQPRAL